MDNSMSRNDQSTTVNTNHGGLTINHNYNGSVEVTRYSIIAAVVKMIADNVEIEDSLDRHLEDYDIEDKIEYNNLQRNAALVDTLYEQYGSVTERAFTTIEHENPGSKSQILTKMKSFYRSALYARGGRQKSTRMSVINQHADAIVDEVINSVKCMISQASQKIDCNLEDFDSAVNCVVGYAIIECLVLEKPLDDNRD